MQYKEEHMTLLEAVSAYLAAESLMREPVSYTHLTLPTNSLV